MTDELTLKDLKQNINKPAYEFIVDTIWDVWSDYVVQKYKTIDYKHFPICKADDVSGFAHYCFDEVGLVSICSYLPNDNNEFAKIVAYCEQVVFNAQSDVFNE